MIKSFKFDLSKPVVLTIYWGAGSSIVKTMKYRNGKPVFKRNSTVKLVHTYEQKVTQSIHNFSTQVVQNWINFPTRSYDKKEWAKLSNETRLNAHIMDYVHDLRSKGVYLSHKVENIG